jgi:hypothetical protein
MSAKAFTALVALIPAIIANPALALSLGISSGASAGAGVSSTSSGGDTSLDLGLTLGLEAGASASAASTTSASATAAAAGAASSSASGNVGLVLNLIQNSDWTMTSFDGMTGLSATVSQVSDGGSTDARASFDAALGVYQFDISELRLALASNAAVSAQLAAQGIDIDSVVAADLAADGTLSLFTD